MIIEGADNPTKSANPIIKTVTLIIKIGANTRARLVIIMTMITKKD